LKDAAAPARGHTEEVTDPGRARGDKRDPVVISDIGTSRSAEIRERERRYVYLMLFRVVCFVAATLIFHGPARWLAVALAVLLPWLAVVLANAPKVQAVKHAVYQPRAPRETPILEPGREHRVIDPDL
jgi:Flp pilus assembly protein TadB